MHTYLVYGFILGSDFEFPELIPTEGEPEVWIRSVEMTRQEVIDFHNGGMQVGSGVDDVVYFKVDNGHTISIHMLEGADVGEVRAMILGGILATLLRQRGLLVVHACSVARDGEAVAFVGDSGWGKSTLAEFFCQNGYRLINDDVVAMDLSGDEVIVVPGYPQIKLRKGAGEALRSDFDTLAPISEIGDKRGSVWTDMFQAEPVPLRRLYFLEPYATDETSVAPISKQEAVRELLTHTRVGHIMTAASFKASNLAQCSDLVQRVPTAWLHRKKSIQALPKVQELIERAEVIA